MSTKLPHPHPWMPASYTPPELSGLPPARLWADLYQSEKPSVRYYFGTPTLNVNVPVPANPDWPINLVSATPSGHVVVRVPALNAGQFTAPDMLIVAYVRGINALPSPEEVLVSTGVKTVEIPFPTNFGVGLDQNIPADVPGPFSPGEYTVYLIGRVPDPA